MVVQGLRTPRVARAFSGDFTHWNGTVIRPAFARGNAAGLDEIRRTKSQIRYARLSALG